MIFTEILERVVGPILFVLGISLILYLLAQQTSFLGTAKYVYVSDNVYSQGDLGMVVDESMMSRDDVIATIISKPVDLVQVYLHDGHFLQVEYGEGSEYVLTIATPGVMPNDSILQPSQVYDTFDDFPFYLLGYGEYTSSYLYEDETMTGLILAEKRGG